MGSDLHPPKKRILTIDGGGFGGLGCLLIIERIMEEVKQRSRRSLVPCQVFDLICGTSTGGLVALLLGRFGLDCRRAIEVYKALRSDSIKGDSWDKLLGSSDFSKRAYEGALIKFLEQEDERGAKLPMSPSGDDTTNPLSSTKTFITVGSFAPEYTNRTYHIRSYATPKGGSASSPAGHKWSVLEAARATLAGRYTQTPPLLIRNGDVEYEFQDAGTLGFNNPTDLARREAKKLWNDDQDDIVISLGTGLLTLTPEQLTSAWSVTDNYAAKFVEQIIAQRPSQATDGIARKSAMAIVKQLLSTAAETELVHTKTASAIGKSGGRYYRINPVLPVTITADDLVDLYHGDHVEKEITKWLDAPEQKQYIYDLTKNIVELALGPVTIEQVREMVPPPPPPETNTGYNPQLDKHRPDTMIGYLENYRVLFVIDDSGSMDREERWGETRSALIGIAAHAMTCGQSEIDIQFFNSSRTCKDVKDVSTIQEIFSAVEPNGGTPTGAVLKRILDTHIAKLDKAIGTSEYYSIKPLDIIVITDGQPTDDPTSVLVDTASHLKKSRHHPNHIGIQFVQIGRDDGADVALQALVSGDIGNMVDTVLYTETLTPQRLERILLGGIHPNLRALLPAA